MTAGVYAIRNTANGMAYIGSSNDVERRMAGHRSALNRGVSKHAKLQAAWSDCRGSYFEFVLLEEAEWNSEALEAAEQRWVDQQGNKLYNAKRRAVRGVRTIEAGRRITIMLAPSVRAKLEALRRYPEQTLSAVVTDLVVNVNTR